MTTTSELNLSPLWDLPSELQETAAVRHFAAGSYVSTAANQSPRSEDGTYVTLTGRGVKADQSRGQYVTTGSTTPSAPTGTYISR
jgi:hypothetical protein